MFLEAEPNYSPREHNSGRRVPLCDKILRICITLSRLNSAETKVKSSIRAPERVLFIRKSWTVTLFFCFFLLLFERPETFNGDSLAIVEWKIPPGRERWKKCVWPRVATFVDRCTRRPLLLRTSRKKNETIPFFLSITTTRRQGRRFSPFLFLFIFLVLLESRIRRRSRAHAWGRGEGGEVFFREGRSRARDRVLFCDFPFLRQSSREVARRP